MLGFFAQDVNSLLQWIVSASWGGYIASNLLKWYWWRFNASGYFYGMIGGLLPALIMPLVLPDLFPNIASDILLLYFFPVLLVISLAACFAGTYLAEPTDRATLVAFYKRVKPWGLWKPVLKDILYQDSTFVSNKNFKTDMIKVVVGIIWQTSLVAMPVFLILTGSGVPLVYLLLLALQQHGT